MDGRETGYRYVTELGFLDDSIIYRYATVLHQPTYSCVSVSGTYEGGLVFSQPQHGPSFDKDAFVKMLSEEGG